MKIPKLTSKGSISLFAFAFIIAFVVGDITLVRTEEPLKVLTLTAIGGALATMGMSKAAGLLGLNFAPSDYPGVLGTILALVVMLVMI